MKSFMSKEPLSCTTPCIYSDTIMESDQSIKAVQSKGAAISHSSGGKIPYVIGSSLCSQLFSIFVATQNMFGHLLEDGIHNQQTGRQIQL